MSHRRAPLAFEARSGDTYIRQWYERSLFTRDISSLTLKFVRSPLSVIRHKNACVHTAQSTCGTRCVTSSKFSLSFIEIRATWSLLSAQRSATQRNAKPNAVQRAIHRSIHPARVRSFVRGSCARCAAVARRAAPSAPSVAPRAN